MGEEKDVPTLEKVTALFILFSHRGSKHRRLKSPFPAPHRFA
jgi:hypothetical protein